MSSLQIDKDLIPKTSINTGDAPVKTGRIIDGKDEYVKRINIGNLPNSATAEYSSGFASNELDIVKISGEAHGSDENKTILTLPYSHSANPVGLWYRNHTSNIIIMTSSDRSSFTGIVEMYFTYK